ncbi:unnamed protein product [Effrenium voratum]|nr:unnamed protein product [Effrenium voratum]
MARGLLVVLVLAPALCFCGGLGRSVGCQPRPRHLRAEDGKGFFDEEAPDWRAGIAGRRGSLTFLGALFLVICYIFTKDEEVRNLKLCVRSKQFEKEFFEDPKKAEWAKQKGYKALQDPDCVEWQDAWEKVKPF